MEEKHEQNLELEVKFLVPNLAFIQEQLLECGATLIKPRIYEKNIRFDYPWDGLKQEGKLLRLRQDSAAYLTYKGKPGQAIESEVRVHEELEIRVEDFNRARAILERLGFHQRQVYEKYRETYGLGGVDIVLDEMPFGDFVEIEGPEADIRKTAILLGLDWEKRILANYLVLLSQLKEKCNLDFDDLTFDNFASVEANAANILSYAI